MTAIDYLIGDVCLGACILVVLAWIAVLAWPDHPPTQDEATRRFIQTRARSMGLSEQEYMARYYPGER